MPLPGPVLVVSGGAHQDEKMKKWWWKNDDGDDDDPEDEDEDEDEGADVVEGQWVLGLTFINRLQQILIFGPVGVVGFVLFGLLLVFVLFPFLLALATKSWRGGFYCEFPGSGVPVCWLALVTCMDSYWLSCTSFHFSSMLFVTCDLAESRWRVEQNSRVLPTSTMMGSNDQVTWTTWHFSNKKQCIPSDFLEKRWTNLRQLRAKMRKYTKSSKPQSKPELFKVKSQK